MASELTKYGIRCFTSHRGHYEFHYRRKFGRAPDLNNPSTLTEKLGWMRLHDRNPLYTKLADKSAVRDYVRERVGEEALIPCYGEYETARKIPFHALPDSFVLKCSHESGFVVICRDKSRLDQRFVRMQMATRLRMNYYYRHLEWPYLNIRPRILAEKLLTEQDGGEPTDYKFHCFDGEPQWIYCVKNRHTKPAYGHYTVDWKPAPFITNGQSASEPIPRPAQLDLMLDTAKTLSRGLNYCRVDLYDTPDQVYFGEMTIIPGAGLLVFEPESYDLFFGERLALPDITD